MKKALKGKVVTVIILIITTILAGVAIFTAIRLYQLRNQAVAPNVPSSKPRAAANVGSCTALTFTLTTSSPTPTSTPSGTPTATPTVGTPTPTPTTPQGTPNSCNGTCGSNFNCASNLVCYQGFCRNPSCTSSTNCVCAGTSTPTPAPSLPQSGTDWPTMLGAGMGIFVIIGSLLLAL